MALRPDEAANLSKVERDQEMRSNIKSGVKGIASIASLAGGAALGSSGLGSKIMPFLSSYIPIDLAMKGINKVRLWD